MMILSMKGRDPFSNPRLLWGHGGLTAAAGSSWCCSPEGQDEAKRGRGEEEGEMNSAGISSSASVSADEAGNRWRHVLAVWLLQ